MNEEKIVLECTKYGILRQKEVNRKKMLEEFSSIEGLFKYDDLKTFYEIKEAIEKANSMRWYENYNCGTSNAIMYICDEVQYVISIPWINRLIIDFFEKYLSVKIEYTYCYFNCEEKMELKKTLDLDTIYSLFDSLSNNFKEDNKYCKEILERLRYISSFKFYEESLEIKFVEGNVTTSFNIPKENKIIIEILKKLAF